MPRFRWSHTQRDFMWQDTRDSAGTGTGSNTSLPRSHFPHQQQHRSKHNSKQQRQYWMESQMTRTTAGEVCRRNWICQLSFFVELFCKSVFFIILNNNHDQHALLASLILQELWWTSSRWVTKSAPSSISCTTNPDWRQSRLCKSDDDREQLIPINY